MRILVALEPRMYGEVIGGAIQRLRPHLKVTIAEPGTIGSEVARLGPEIVLYSQHKPTSDTADGRAWIEYRPYSEPKATIRIGCQRWKMDVFVLTDLLSVVDRTESLWPMMLRPEVANPEP